MKKLITYLKALWSWVADSQRNDRRHDCRLTVGSPSGLDAKWKQNLFMRFAVFLTLIFTIGVGDVWGYTGTFTQSTGTLTSGYYVIGNVESSTIHAINNTVGTSWIKYTDITISSSKITNPSNAVVWYYDASAGTIKNVDNTNYIYWTSGNVGCCGTTSYQHDVTETSTSGVYNIKSHATPTRILARNGTSGYRYYAGTQTKEIQFWKLGSTCSNKVTISKGSESHGTFELNKTGEQDACDALSVTVTPEADEHYHVASVSATNPATSGTAGAAVDNGDGTWTITYSANAKGASTINVTFAENTKHTLTFYNNGAQVEQIQVYDGEKIGASLPNLTSSEACHATSRTFAGWTTENIGSTPVHTVDVDKIVDYWTEPTANMSIYALWATIPASATTTFAAADYSAETAPVTKSKDNITLYFDAGSIYKTNTPYTFSITSGDHYFSITASNKVLAKLETTCNDGTYCIYDVSDGTLSPNSSTASQTVTDINTYSVECYPKSNKQIRMQTCAVYCYDNYITACAACAADPTRGSASLKGGFSLTSVGVTATGWDAGTNCSWTDYGFVWGTSANPTVSDNKVPVGNSGTTTTWDGTLTGSFTTSTTYHFRAYGKNGKDGATYQYSDDATFTPRQVSFNMHGHGGDAPANQVVNNGGKATDPGDPSEAGWTFGGWYNNDSYTGSAWVFGTNTVSGGNVTLHAKWTEKPKYTITLNAGNGTVSEAGWEKDGDVWKQQQSNGDASITFPSASSNCAGWEFVGWATSAANNVSSDPTSEAAGATLVPASNVTYYAVYRQNATGGTTYNKITSTGDLTTGDYIIISSSSYAMKNKVNSGGTYMDESSSGTFSASGSSIETSASEYIWTIVKFGSQVVIKNGTDFLGINDNNNICLSTTPHFFTYTYNTTNSRWEFTSATKTTYQLVYNSYFKMLTSQSTAIYLYKQGAGLTGNYYTNPTCSDLSITGVADPAAGGSVTLSATSAKSGEKVYAYYTEDLAYRFNSWSVSGTGTSISSTTAKFTEITVGSADVTLTANFDARVMYSVTWKANGEELTGVDLGSASTSVETGEKITNLPPNPSSCDGTSTTFMGWVAEGEIWSGPTDDVSAKHIYTAASEIPAVTGNVVYHAVWARQNGSAAPATYAGTGVFTKITTMEELEVGAHYVLYGTKDDDASVKGAMNNTFTVEASGKNVFGASAVTISDNKITNPATTIVWKLGGTTNAYTLYSQNSSKYVEITANDTRGYTNPSSPTTSFTITVSEGNFKIITNNSSAGSRMISIYTASVFRSYSNLTEGYTLNLYKYGSNYTYDRYLVKCCNTPTLTFAASPYAVLREDIQGASTTTWAEVDVTFTSNSSGEISATKYSNATVTNGTAYVLAASKWQVYETTGGTLCGATHAYFEVLTQPSGETPGTGKFHVKTAAGQTGQGTYRIAITQEATNESNGNFCETTVYGFVNVTLRDKFVDNVNGNGTINRDGHGAQLATPTLSELDTQDEDACHDETRKLKGWIKESDLKSDYVTGTRVTELDNDAGGFADLVAAGKVVAPGTNVTMSGVTWYAVWAYEK